MNWHLLIGIVAAAVQLYAIVPYVRDILRRETRPNVVSWALWTVLQVVAIWIQLTSKAGMSWSLFLLIAMTFNTLLVVVLCLRGYGNKEFGFVEGGSLCLAVVAIVFYAITRNGPWAIGFDVLGDFVAAAPTIWKTWRDPHSEAYGPWAIVAVAAALGALSVETVSAETIALPIYLALVNGFIAALAFSGRNKKQSPVA